MKYFAYRGLWISLDPGDRITIWATPPEYISEFRLVRQSRHPPITTIEVAKQYIDRVWSDLMDEVHAAGLVSCDGAPWELHGIRNRRARVLAVRTFHRNSSE